MHTNKEIAVEPHVTEWFMNIEKIVTELILKRQGALDLLVQQHKLEGQWQATPDFTKLVRIDPEPVKAVKIEPEPVTTVKEKK